MCTLNLNSRPNNIRRGQWALVHGYHEVPCWDWHWPSSDLPANFLDFVFTSITFISCLTPISVWVRKSIWTPQIELLKPLLREWQPFGQNHCVYHHIFCQPCFLLPSRVGTFKTETMSSTLFLSLVPALQPTWMGNLYMLHAVLGQWRRHGLYLSPSLEASQGDRILWN